MDRKSDVSVCTPGVYVALAYLAFRYARVLLNLILGVMLSFFFFCHEKLFKSLSIISLFFGKLLPVFPKFPNYFKACHSQTTVVGSTSTTCVVCRQRMRIFDTSFAYLF